MLLSDTCGLPELAVSRVARAGYKPRQVCDDPLWDHRATAGRTDLFHPVSSFTTVLSDKS